jgi:hypothetical protein
MSDRTDRAPDLDSEFDTETADELDLTLEEQLDEEMLADDPFPRGPNDEGFEASPPVEAAHPRVSDDDDLDTEGSGLQNTPFRSAYEDGARRADLARRLEELLVDVQEWAQEDGSEQARWIHDALADAYEQLDMPPEDTDAEPAGVLQAEASQLGKPSASQRGLGTRHTIDDDEVQGE